MLTALQNSLTFAAPAGAWFFLAVAVVAALYLFHRRYRPQRATGLFLWGAPRRDTTGGRTRENLLRSRAFWFDLAAAFLLASALTAPQWIAPNRTRVIILDNAITMRSRDNHREAARIAAETAAAARQAAVVIAGARPRVAKALAPAAEQDLTHWLETNYAPAETESDLPRALRFAKEVYGASTDIHIITNKTDAELSATAAAGATVHTLAGQGGNLAFGHIWRKKNAGGETLFLGVENFGEAADAILFVLQEENESAIFQQPLRLPTGTTHLEIPVAEQTRNTLRITLTAEKDSENNEDNENRSDSIAADSEARVLPAAPGRPTVAVTDLPPTTRRAAETAFLAAGCPITNDPSAAELLVTGNEDAEGRVATLHILAEHTPAIARPPFRIDASSPLCRDLDLSGAAWTVAAREHEARPDETYIAVGATPLYWREGENTFFLNLLPERGNITRTPAWPVLLENLSARVSSLSPEARSPAEGLPLYGDASDTRTLSPRAAITQAEPREDEATGSRDLRWSLFLAAAALIGCTYYSSARRGKA